jgi:molybdate transport repressor ModE-like protein
MMKKLRVKHRVWIELDEDRSMDQPPVKGRRKKDSTSFIVGLGVARLLSAIKETRSLTLAAGKLGYSYKYAWDRTQKIKDRLGETAVEAHKGGKGGGGEMMLSPAGDEILRFYTEWDDFIKQCMKHKADIIKSGLLDKN